MLKKMLAGFLGASLTITLGAPAAAVYAAEEMAEEYCMSDAELVEEDFFDDVPEELSENVFVGGGVIEDAFSDGEAAFTDEAAPEDLVTEKTLDVVEGEDITVKLNTALLEMRDKATDEKMCKVIIPPGNYVITNTICTYSNIHLYAVGAVITKVSPERHLILRLGNTDESAGGYEGYRNVIIEGGTWDSNFHSIPDIEAEGGFVMFRIGHATNVQIKDATFLNNLKSHCVEFGGVKDASVTGCTFRGYWKGYTGGGQEAIQLDACRDYILPGYLPYDGTVCENILIEGNTFEDVFAGVGSHSMVFDRPYKNIVIRGNTFRDVAKRAIWCLNYVDSVIENNVMVNVGSGIYVRSLYSKNTHLLDGAEISSAQNQYASNILIANNEISLKQPTVIGENLWKSFGIGLIGEKCPEGNGNVPAGQYPVTGVTVKNNKVSGPGHGIRLIMANNCLAVDNVLELTDATAFENNGFVIGASCANKITKNRIKGMKASGIFLYRGSSDYNEASRDNILTENTITAGGGDGIMASVSSHGTKIEKNTVTGVEGNGIHIWKNTGTIISGNTVDNCKLNGILVADGNKTSVSGNTVNKNGIDGIKTESVNKKLSVRNNRCIKNYGAGMCIIGGIAPVLSQNEIVANKNNGISLLKSTDVNISGNNIRSNKGYAVIGTDSSVKIYNENILKNNDHTNTIYVINTSLPYSVEKIKRKNK